MEGRETDIEIEESVDLLEYDSDTVSALSLFSDVSLDNSVSEPSRAASSQSSVFEILNRTQTPMGRSKLKLWMLRPLTNLNQINARQQCVAVLINNVDSLNLLRDSVGAFGKLPDLGSLGQSRALDICSLAH